MDSYWVVALLIYAVVFGTFCGYIASQKNRDATNWFVLGAIFGLVALIAIAAVPALEQIELDDGAQKIDAPINPLPGPDSSIFPLMIIGICLLIIVIAAFALK